MASRLRFSQCPTSDENSAHAHATPPSRNPNRSSGNRFVTPERNNDLHSDSCAAARPFTWLYT